MIYLLRLDPHLPWQPAAVEAAKRAVYDGFRAAAETGAGPGQFGVIVDERSTVILRDAIAHGFQTACSVGAVGSQDFDNKDPCGSAVHPVACAVSYWRVVVRFNPADEHGLASRQLEQLRRLSEALRPPSRPRLICDLVVPPTQWQLTHGIRVFDRELLPQLTSSALAWLLDAGVTPELWVIEGFEQQSDYQRVLDVATRNDHTIGCLVRAAGHSDATTLDLMTVGLSMPRIVGVVLGPAPFWEPVATWMMGRTTRSRAVAGVAEQFRSWVDRLEATRTCQVAAEQHC